MWSKVRTNSMYNKFKPNRCIKTCLFLSVRNYHNRCRFQTLWFQWATSKVQLRLRFFRTPLQSSYRYRTSINYKQLMAKWLDKAIELILVNPINQRNAQGKQKNRINSKCKWSYQHSLDNLSQAIKVSRLEWQSIKCNTCSSLLSSNRTISNRCRRSHINKWLSCKA